MTKAMNFQDDIHSTRFDNFRDHHESVYDLTLMQIATENCQYPELVVKPLRLELNLTLHP